MVKAVAPRGYDAVTVRELTGRAKVSSRDFYRHFTGKSDCFLRTYDKVVQSTAKRITAAQVGERDWEARVRLAFGAFAGEVARHPDAARLALIGAYGAGPVALDHIRRAEWMFGGMIEEGFANSPDGPGVPPLLTSGMTMGVSRIVRMRLLIGCDHELSDLGEKLSRWALSYRGESMVELSELDLRAAEDFNTRFATSKESERSHAARGRDGRSLILAATERLAVADGYASLTVPRIHVAAGVSRRAFNAHFTGVKDCFLAALDQHTEKTIAQASEAQATSQHWEGSVYLAVRSLCAWFARDPSLARLCLVDVLSPGVAGLLDREGLMNRMVNLLKNAAPSSHSPDTLALEASVGVIWGVFHRYIASGRSSHLPAIAATLSFFVLAPVVGTSAAIRAIREEQGPR
jgi:AcrR family transcriptional regulator